MSKILSRIIRCKRLQLLSFVPGSSMFFKCWPLEGFREVTDWIIDTYNLDIHICGGGKEEEAMAVELINKVRNKDRIVSHVNRTSFKEWSSIVLYAKFVFGNDRW